MLGVSQARVSQIEHGQVEFHANAAAGILVLVLLLLSMNAIAIWLRDRYTKKGAA